MGKWILINSDYSMDVYKRWDMKRPQRDYLHIDKQRKTAKFSCEVFVYKDAPHLVPQSHEPNEWIKWSSSYGHWESESLDATVEDLEFALNVLMAIKERRTGGQNG